MKKSIEMVLLWETREEFAAVVFVRDAVGWTSMPMYSINPGFRIVDLSGCSTYF